LWSTLSSRRVALTTVGFAASKLGEYKSMHRRVVGLAAGTSEEKIRGRKIKSNRLVYSVVWHRPVSFVNLMGKFRAIYLHIDQSHCNFVSREEKISICTTQPLAKQR
jgi:hypothetical protein